LNFAAGLVYSRKDETNTTIALTHTKEDAVILTSTKYPQGRNKPVLYGPPYSVCLGFPLITSKMVTNEKIQQQRLFIRLFIDRVIYIESLFGSAKYLVAMLHGGNRVNYLAYTEGHRILLKKENEDSKVLIFNTVCLVEYII
jgi:hypothetical protein